jgi:hypothetical protein
MDFSTYNRALLRGMAAGAVILSGVTACSRSDRADAGRDTTQSVTATATPSDTASTTLDTSTATAKPGTARPQSTASGAIAGRDTTSQAGEESVSGYREMERDTAQPDTRAAAGHVDSSVVSSDSTASSDTTSVEMAGATNAADSAGAAADQALTADTTVAGYSAMARDTSSAPGLGDTAAVAVTDTTLPAESDTSNIQVQIDTATAQAQADTAHAGHTDTLAMADSAVTASTPDSQVAVEGVSADAMQDKAGGIRPPEDSTEILGNVTSDTTTVASGDVSNEAEAEPIRPPEDSTEIEGNVTGDEDRAAVAASEARPEAAGAAPMGRTVTGAQAVSLMSWGGVRCVVVGDDSAEASWDIADSPATLNPCGPGTMTLSRIRTGETH